MNGLLKSCFNRLLKNKLFWCLGFVMLGVGVYSVFIEFLYGSSAVNHYIGLGNTCSPIVLIALAVLIPLFIGTDYSDGTLRNKIISGHSRISVYLSNLATAFFSAIVLAACFLIPYVILGITLLDGIDPEIKHPILISLAGSAIYTLIVMSSQNKARTVALCIVIAIIMLAIGLGVSSSLAEPEFFYSYYSGPDGTLIEVKNAPNPNYISGYIRSFLEFLGNALPGAQAFMLAGEVSGGNVVMAIYSIAVAIISTLCGVIVFSKKNLK